MAVKRKTKKAAGTKTKPKRSKKKPRKPMSGHGHDGTRGQSGCPPPDEKK